MYKIKCNYIKAIEYYLGHSIERPYKSAGLCFLCNSNHYVINFYNYLITVINHVIIFIIVLPKKHFQDTLIRFGISIEPQLLIRFDNLISQKGYSNRSEAIRDLIRETLVQQEFYSDVPVIGTITILYDHNIPNITHKITHFQHQYNRLIISTLHIHLPNDNCMEVIALKGSGNQMKQFSDALIGMKGVKHGKLTVTSIGAEL